MSSQKRAVIERFVELLSGYVPLKKAMLATLGGQGLEARVWKKFGISQKRAYLVERSPSRMRRLIQGFRSAQHVYADLKSFPEIFKAKHGNEAGLDMFHWDLCGTVEPVIRDLVNILPLIAQSRGKCLALTVADQRRNRSLQSQKQLLERAERVFGSRASGLSTHLLDFHTALASLPFGQADPKKVALRELGVMTYLAEAFASSLPGKAMMPNRLERFIYISDGFRMRSYFFHFGREGSAERLAGTMANLIVQAPIYWVDGDRPMQIEHAGKEMQVAMKTKTEVDQILGRLDPLLKRLGKESADDILALADRARQCPDVSLIRSAIELLNKALDPAPAPSPTRKGKAKPKANPEVPTSTESTSGSQVEPAIYEPDKKVRDLDEIRLELYKAANLGDAAFQQKCKEVIPKLEVAEGKDPNRVVISIMAHGRGKFRGQYVARMLLSRRDGKPRHQMLEELAQVLDESAKTLLSKAKKTTFWKNRNA